MRRGNNSKRQRNGRPNNGGGRIIPNLGHSLESSSPEGNKVRGNAGQLYDRYTNLAREAQSAGDRVAAEGYLQYAEHYYRVLSAAGQQRRPNGGNGNAPGTGPAQGQGGQPGTEGGGDPQQQAARGNGGNGGGNGTANTNPAGNDPIHADPDDDLPPVN